VRPENEITPEEAAEELYNALLCEIEDVFFTGTGKFDDGVVCVVVHLKHDSFECIETVPAKWGGYWVVVDYIDLEHILVR